MCLVTTRFYGAQTSSGKKYWDEEIIITMIDTVLKYHTFDVKKYVLENNG